MKGNMRITAACIGLGISALLTVFLFVNRDRISLRPWDTAGKIEVPTYAETKGNRTAVIADSEKSVILLNEKKELIYRINADLRRTDRFSAAKFAALDEENNLYVLDANYGGVLEDSVERVLKYSEKGVFLNEVYTYRYTSEDYILTKGKIGGMAYHAGLVYLVRLERDGFWLDRAAASGGDTGGTFFEYPNALRDSAYCHINTEEKRLTLTTKAGGIKRYDFDGNLVYEQQPAEGEKSLPWTAVSDNQNNIIYTDILTGEIVHINTVSGVRSVFYTVPAEKSPYYRINYAGGRFTAASYDSILIGGEDGKYEILSSYSYTPSFERFRVLLFAAGILDILVLAAMAVLFISSLLKRKINRSLKMILLTGMCIAFGAVIASVLIINEMSERYKKNAFTFLENISSLMAVGIDTDVLSSISSPADYNSEEYLRFKESLLTQFSTLQFNGERIYQIIWILRDDYVYCAYDLESSAGIYFPAYEYPDNSYYGEIFDGREYVHNDGAVTAEGSWLFVCGPVFDREGNVAALIETGYNMRSVQEQTRLIIIRTLIIVSSVAVLLLLAVALPILFLGFYRKKRIKKEITKKVGYLSLPVDASPGRGIRIKAACIGLGIIALLSVFLLVNRELISLRPWENGGAIELPTYAEGNGQRTAIIADSEKSVVVLNAKNELVYRINADPRRTNRFFVAKFAALDEENNLYVLDANFGGVLEDNVERVLKYSEKGDFLNEIYTYRYINDDYILTKGKIGGMAYYAGLLYLVRLERDGFWLEWTEAEGGEKRGTFFEYPNALRDLGYCHINAEKNKLTFTTKAGGIKRYGFDGVLVYEQRPAEGEKSLPWTAVSDNQNNIVYTDILTGEIIRINTTTGERTAFYTVSEEVSPYYRINYAEGTFAAASYESIFIGSESGEHEIVSSYSYTPSFIRFRGVLFAGGILDILLLAVVLGLFISSSSKKKIGGSLKTILLTGACIAFGAVIASVLIINEMNSQYEKKMFNDLENISRLITTTIDPDTLLSISSPVDYDSEKYLRFKESQTAQFSTLQYQGERIYQLILMRHDTNLDIMYDLESSIGTYYPFDVYADGPYKEAYETRNYVHVSGAVTSEGSWLFVCGPIFDREGNVAALIETGYNMRSVLEQTRTIIIQTSLIVAAATVAFLLIIIEFILILTAYKKNKNEIKHRSAPFSRRTARALVVLMVEAYKKIVKQESSKHIIPEHIKKAIAFMLESYKKKAESTKDPPFYPELLRALIFFLFIANNLEAALLPMYAANLYEPLFNFSKEFVITLPLVADMGSAALALLIIPLIFEKFGIKRIGLLAVIFIFIGNIMCFIAANTAHLAVAHFFTGFAGGSLLLVINAIIGAQKDVKDVNSGFAHFNASYLAGVNVGVVIGSILAQFFPYRMVYLFSSLAALILVFIFIFSIRSKLLKHFYDITGFANTQEPGEKSSLLKFIFKPVVLGTLLLLLLPYAMSLSFTSYFMPIYGIENGLRESNVGQLILLSGLFAILFGTSLCEYAGQKLSLKMIITISLLLNVGGIFLFSLSVSVFMLILAVAVLAVANIFAATYIQTFYSTLYQNENISSAKALSVYSAVENISMSIGPIVYSYILAYNIGTGMMLFASGALVCLVVFLISSFLSDRGNKRRLSL